MHPPAGYTLGPIIAGRAGASRVYAAQRPGGTPCALKTLDTHDTPAAWRIARFRRECELHVAASAIDGVASARTIGDGGLPWLDVDWAHGGDLAAVVERAGGARVVRSPRDGVEPIAIVATLAATVASLHALGIAHRDIKPSNILIDGTSVWLADFGVAAQHGVSLPSPFIERAAGTPEWSAPELLRSPPGITTASDVYALGRVWQWIESLDGRTPVHDPLRDAMLASDATHRPPAAIVATRLRHRIPIAPIGKPVEM